MSLITILPFKKQATSAGGMIILIILFMWISADFIYGAYADMVRTTMTIYFFTFLLAYTVINQQPKSMQPKQNESIWNFVIGFVGTGAILFGASFIIAPLLSTASIVDPFIASVTITGLGFGGLHGFVKAYIEESVFRWALPMCILCILFGVFHLAVLVSVTIPAIVAQGQLVDLGVMNWQYAIAPVIMLIGLGFIWSQVRNHFGIMGSTGSHMSWNLFALGILPMIFLGGVVS